MSKKKKAVTLRDRYVMPSDAGLASTPEAVGRRLGKLLDALGDHITRWVVQGPIEHELWEYRQQLIKKLEANGWEVKIGTNDKFRVKPISYEIFRSDDPEVQ